MFQNWSWKGSHGEWYVIAQIVLIVLVFFGPRNLPGAPEWQGPFMWFMWPSRIAGGVILAAGLALLLIAIFRLGPGLTPLPYPKEEGKLVETGPYGLVRHPMYCGGILISLGWALAVHGWLTLGYALVMVLFLHIKSRREEEWLKAKFSGYEAYQKRVRKLIPFIF